MIILLPFVLFVYFRRACWFLTVAETRTGNWFLVVLDQLKNEINGPVEILRQAEREVNAGLNISPDQARHMRAAQIKTVGQLRFLDLFRSETFGQPVC
jgi:hypothetical protein